MKQRIKIFLASLGLIVSAGFAMSTPALAVNPGFGGCSANPGSAVCRANGTDNVQKILKNVINILLFVVGSVAIILIIVGGIKYTTSAGDSNSVNSAKNTIIYAVVGLVISAMAWAIVNFVLKNI